MTTRIAYMPLNTYPEAVPDHHRMRTTDVFLIELGCAQLFERSRWQGLVRRGPMRLRNSIEQFGRQSFDALRGVKR